jgi:aspartate/methionine/tyrosine aminotransferase
MVESFFLRKLLVKSGLAKYLPGVRQTLGGGEDFLHHYADRTLSAPLTELLDRALLPDTSTPDSIHLALGAPPCELHLSLPRQIDDRLPSAWGDFALRQELAVQFHLEHGPESDPADEVFLTHGATGAFACVLDALINPGDKAVLFDPTSPIFPIGLKHRRAKIDWVPSTTTADGDVAFDLAAFAKSLRGAKLLVLADPANPTGGVFAAEDLQQIAFWAKKYDVLVVQDASFSRWQQSKVGHDRLRLASLPNIEGRLITIGSFAKSHGLSSARVGWLTGHRHLVRPCALAGMMNAPFVAPLCQQVALSALRLGQGVMTSLRDDFAARRVYVRDRLEQMGLRPRPNRGGFFFWVPLPDDVAPGTGSRGFAQELLSKTGVLVNPGAPFGPSGDRFLRISYATDEGRLREGLARLESFLERRHEPAAKESSSFELAGLSL